MSGKRVLHTYLIRHITGLHYAVRILIGSTLLWIILYREQTADSLWAIISLIVVTEPQMRMAWLAFRARMINTTIGCLIGLAFLYLFGPFVWLLTPAITVSALMSTVINKVQQGWRIAPVTTALIMSAGMTQHSASGAMELALHRTMEVFLGSVAALLVTKMMGFFWLPVDETAKTQATQA